MKKNAENFINAFYALIERVEAGGCQNGAVEDIDQEYALVMHPKTETICVADKQTMRPIKMRKANDGDPKFIPLYMDYMTAC